MARRALMCRHLRLIGGMAALVLLVAVRSGRADEPFDSCGTLVQGAECVLFDADGGGEFTVASVDQFKPGDRVRVVGRLERNCATACLQGDGCITNNSISDCSGQFAACGTLVNGAECVLFESDSGLRYVLDNLGGSEVGDRVR